MHETHPPACFHSFMPSHAIHATYLVLALAHGPRHQGGVGRVDAALHDERLWGVDGYNRL